MRQRPPSKAPPGISPSGYVLLCLLDGCEWQTLRSRMTRHLGYRVTDAELKCYIRQAFAQ